MVADLIEIFIARWQAAAGGSERANYQIFITELCDLLGPIRCQQSWMPRFDCDTA